MAKTRWKTIETVCRTDHADIHRVQDQTRELSGAYALKKLKIGRNQRATEKARLRFKQEILTSRRLALSGCPVVDPVDDGTDPAGSPWYVMTFYSNGNLESWAKEHSVAGGLLLVVPMALQLHDALRAFHEEGVVHRDFKPKNVFIDATGAPILGDLGLGFNLEEQGDDRATSSDEPVGSRDYRAPETMKRTVPAPPLDYYSFGKTLDFLARGEVLPGFDKPVADLALASRYVGESWEVIDNLVCSLLSEDPRTRTSAWERSKADLELCLRLQDEKRSSDPIRRVFGRLEDDPELATRQRRNAHSHEIDRLSNWLRALLDGSDRHIQLKQKAGRYCRYSVSVQRADVQGYKIPHPIPGAVYTSRGINLVINSDGSRVGLELVLWYASGRGREPQVEYWVSARVLVNSQPVVPPGREVSIRWYGPGNSDDKAFEANLGRHVTEEIELWAEAVDAEMFW